MSDAPPYLVAEVNRIAAAIRSVPGWAAESLAVIETESRGVYQLQILARHNGEESARLIRDMREWEQELRTHVCPGERGGGQA